MTGEVNIPAAYFTLIPTYSYFSWFHRTPEDPEERLLKVNSLNYISSVDPFSTTEHTPHCAGQALTPNTRATLWETGPQSKVPL